MKLIVDYFLPVIDTYSDPILMQLYMHTMYITKVRFSEFGFHNLINNKDRRIGRMGYRSNLAEDMKN